MGSGRPRVALGAASEVRNNPDAPDTGHRLPSIGGALSLRRRVTGFALTAVGLPLLTWILSGVRSPDSVTTEVLVFQLFIVIVALVGGIWPALTAAVAGGFFLDFFFVEPLYTIRITQPAHLVALAVFLVVATLVSIVVDQSARRYRAASRSAAESEVLVEVAGGVIESSDAIEALVARLREAFGAASVTLLENGQPALFSSDPDAAAPTDDDTVFEVGTTATLTVRGRALGPSDRRILGVFVSQLASALERRRLAAEAEGMRPLAAADRLRSALLAAVGHDLRTPLAAAAAAISSLLSKEVVLSEPDRAELLETADESLAVLATLVTDLLDASRLQAGVLGVTLSPVALDSAVGDAVEELRLSPGEVGLELEEPPAALADPALLQRVLVNLLSNALRYSPPGTMPIVTTSSVADRVRLRVIDFGPGIPADRRTEVFLPFQRLGDTDNSTGIGLGLALSKGFIEAMNGTLEAEDTPTGGLTMVIDLEAAK